MVHAILNFPHIPPRSWPSPTADHRVDDSEGAIPTHQLWRRLPAESFGETERVAMNDLLAAARPFGVAHWPEACAGDAAAAVAMALKMCGVDVLDTVRHDLVMTMLLAHALAGSAAAKATLAFTLVRRRYLGEDVDALVRSWQGPSRADIRRASIQALMEALS
jgi:hypothetical protein